MSGIKIKRHRTYIYKMKYSILFVDDEPANLRMLERLFRGTYNVITAGSGAEAIETLGKHDIALIVSDQRMPGMTGIELLMQAAAIRPHTVRIILTGYTDVSDLVEAINSGIVYKYITKPWVNADLRQTIQRAIEHFESRKDHHSMMLQNARLEDRVRGTIQGFVNMVREMIAQRDPSLADHCRRTSNFAALIGEQCGLSPAGMEELIFAALLHEAPNLKMPQLMDFDSESWSPEQYKSIRNGFENSTRLISSVPDLVEVAEIISGQHERYDGKGLFQGLRGDAIPLNARILAVANAFDDLSSGRDPAMLCTDEEAAEWLRERAGSCFDPEVVELCLHANLFEPTRFPASIRSTAVAASLAGI